MWKLIKDKKPPMYRTVIVSDGDRSLDAWLEEDGEYRRADYMLKDVKFEPKAWCEMPKWEGEK